MTTEVAIAGPVTPRSLSLPVSWGRRAGYIALAAYTLYALSTLDITWARIERGLPQGAKFLSRMWPPNFEAQKLQLMREGMIESIEIAILADSSC